MLPVIRKDKGVGNSKIIRCSSTDLYGGLVWALAGALVMTATDYLHILRLTRLKPGYLAGWWPLYTAFQQVSKHGCVTVSGRRSPFYN